MFQLSTFPMKRRESLSKKLGTVLLSASFLIHPMARGQENRTLEVGKPLERELAGGQSHAYQIALAAGQYLHVVAEQRGIDVVVTLFGPHGKKLTEIDGPNGTVGPEPVKWITESNGSYRLEVRSFEKEAQAGRYEVKIVDLRAATEIDRALVGALILHHESEGLRSKGKYDEAIPLAERALTLIEKALDPSHPEVAISLNYLADLYDDRGEYAKAEPLYQRALEIREKALPPDHPDVAQSLYNLAVVHRHSGEYAKAEPLHQRALKIYEQLLGANLQVARSVNDLALLYKLKGDFAKAEPLYQRALEIYERELGPNHRSVATLLNNLAELYRAEGVYAKAEPRYQRAIVIYEKELGPNHFEMATPLDNLALLYRTKGDYTNAESLHQRAIEIREKARGPNHPLVALSLNNLAALYRDKGEYAKAESLHRRALEIYGNVLPPIHPFIGLSLHNLATLYFDQRDYEKAEALFQRAIGIQEKSLGPNHPSTAYSVFNLAGIYHAKSDYAKAEPLYQRALKIRENALGPNHPETADSLVSLAALYRDKGDFQQAIAFGVRATEVSEYNLGHVLVTGSERQKLLFLALHEIETDFTLSLHAQFAPNDPQALKLALTTLLRRKGRGLEAATDAIAPLRHRARPEDQALLDQLSGIRSQLANLTLIGPEGANTERYRSQLKQLEEDADRLEADLSSRNAEFRVQNQRVTIEAIQASLPKDAALVEFAVYRPYDTTAKKIGPVRYSAYALTSQGEARSVDLGEVAPIDRALANLRQALRNPQRTDAKRLARAVEAQVMQPVRAILGNTRRVLISTEGALNLVPFAALVDERSHYLVEDYSISYLTSGRDLLRLQVPRPSNDQMLIVANPDFGAPVDVVARLADNTRLSSPIRQQIRGPLHNFSEVYFEPLPETGREAQAIKNLLPQATVLTKAQATEAALKKISAPHILHVATHGFFLQDEEVSEEKTRGLSFVGRAPDMRGGNWAAKIKNPLLRSGLALAGFNRHQSGDDDGVLTALEAAGLDLYGTRLVVLSACDTGVGEVKNGEGIYGLRRALVLAGSETQVMSLWKVSDYVTRLWMTDYYTGLQQGLGRGEALRQVQLKMLKSKKRQHPFYWGSFIQSGEWGTLEGKR